jgi:hypothetical protein
VLYFQARRDGLLLKLFFFDLKWIQWRLFGPHLAMNRGMLTWNIWNNKKYHDAAGFWPSTKVPIWSGHSWDIVIQCYSYYCILLYSWWCTAVIGGYDLFSPSIHLQAWPWQSLDVLQQSTIHRP